MPILNSGLFILEIYFFKEINKMIKKRIITAVLFVSLVSVLALSLTGCFKNTSIEELDDSKVFVIKVLEAGDNEKLMDRMNALKDNKELTFEADETGMITSINGKSQAPGEYWMLYTDDEAYSNKDWGTYTYEGNTIGSASLGAASLPIKSGKVYVWVLTSFK